MTHARVSETAHDQAIAWFARLRAHDVTDAQHGDFAEWLAADPGHAEAFDAIVDLWEGLDEVADPVEVAPRWPRIAAAAGVLVAVFVLLLTQVAGTRIETAVGEQRRIALEDGSSLHLNTASTSIVRYTSREREVTLEEGEAFVTVAPNPARPFVVATREGRAEALGTAFAVHAAEAGTVVTVAEGTVAFTSTGGERAVLAPGDRLTVGPEGVVRTTVDPARVALWTTGRLEYDDVPLGALIADLNRYFPVQMVLADPAIGDQRVLASVRLTDQEGLLDTLNETLGLEWHPVSDELIIIQAAN